MRQIAPRTAVYVFIDVLLLAACAYHLPYLSQRGTLPFSVSDFAGQIVVTDVIDSTAANGIRPGDQLEPLGGDFRIGYHRLEYFTDFYRWGDTLVIAVRQPGMTIRHSVTLVRYYPVLSVLMFVIVSLVTWCVAVVVLLARPPNLTGSVLHWALMSMSVIVVMAWSYIPPDDWWPYLSRTLFFLSYGGVMPTALLFTTLFPQPKWGPVSRKSIVLYTPIIVLTAGMLHFHFRALALHSIPDYDSFETFDDLFHLSSPLYLAGMVVSLIHSYATAESGEERKKLQWILWGICVGPMPFFLLTMLPGFFLPGGLLTESYTLLFLVIIPMAFGISFVKYHILDVEVVISRTTAYAAVATVLMGVYILITGVVASKVGEATASAGAAILVALLFEPARRRVQSIVDRKFFRVRYNFREALRRLSNGIKLCIDEHQLAGSVITQLQEVIPVERLGVVRLEPERTRLTILAHKGIDAGEGRGIRLKNAFQETLPDLPIALEEKVEAGIAQQPAERELFVRWKLAIVFPLRYSSGAVLGFLALGEKKSGERFTIEDVDLLSSVADEAGIEFERIMLQQKLMREEAETHRLGELNRMKSDFVSHVSHELKTPLTSIKLFAELLRARVRKSNGKSNEYINIIEGEADRLNRMVSTILDSTRIEQGVQRYSFVDADLGDIVVRVMRMMRFQLDRAGFVLRFSAPKRRFRIHADPDAVAEALMNLVANAIKYAGAKKSLAVSLGRRDDGASCTVKDRGRGIPEESLPHLFEKFYRDPSSAMHIEGMGLGLSVVKHIMEAHGGSIEVKSVPGKGSAFTLFFPLHPSTNNPGKDTQQ